MEQIQNENRRAAAGRSKLAAARALELEAKHPQISLYDNQPEHTESISGGNEAGLRRVVGGRRRKAAKARSPSPSDTEAHREGKMLADHLGKLHGGGFLDDFAKGFMSVIRPVAQVASFVPGPIGMAGKVVSGLAGRGRAGGARCVGGAGMAPEIGGEQVGHAMMSPARAGLPGSGTGGQDVPPGGMAPVAYGNVPQAPASFARNTVGMGRAGGGMLKIAHGGMAHGGGMLQIEHGGARRKAAMPKEQKKSSQRGQMISRLMKEQGMTLGQASKYLKEHGSA
jgi:hypothetical protein